MVCARDLCTWSVHVNVDMTGKECMYSCGPFFLVYYFVFLQTFSVSELMLLVLFTQFVCLRLLYSIGMLGIFSGYFHIVNRCGKVRSI